MPSCQQRALSQEDLLSEGGTLHTGPLELGSSVKLYRVGSHSSWDQANTLTTLFNWDSFCCKVAWCIQQSASTHCRAAGCSVNTGGNWIAWCDEQDCGVSEWGIGGSGRLVTSWACSGGSVGKPWDVAGWVCSRGSISKSGGRRWWLMAWLDEGVGVAERGVGVEIAGRGVDVVGREVTACWCGLFVNTHH